MRIHVAMSQDRVALHRAVDSSVIGRRQKSRRHCRETPRKVKVRVAAFLARIFQGLETEVRVFPRLGKETRGVFQGLEAAARALRPLYSDCFARKS
jgi:hypothetical protein